MEKWPVCVCTVFFFLVCLHKKGCDDDDDNNDELSSLGHQSTMEVFKMPDDVHAARNNQI
eukprot:7418912-Ditylum_brightwellii.AAC.1